MLRLQKLKGTFEENLIDNTYAFQIIIMIKLINLFNNSDTLSFIDLLLNFKSMLKKVITKFFLNSNFIRMMTLPFFYF